MSLPAIFTFAPIPLTNDLSPLAHAAALAKRRQAENLGNIAAPRTRVSIPSRKTLAPENLVSIKG